MVYQIPEWNKEEFLKKINSLKKKGLDVKVEEIGPSVYTYTDDHFKTVDYKCTDYEVSTEIVYQVPGWKFIGTIEHTDAGNIIRKAFKTEVPKIYYTAPCECEHCRTIRNRKDTYLVSDNDNNFKQVGKACLKAYTGLEPSVCAYAMSIEAEIAKLEADPEKIRSCGGSYSDYRYFGTKYIISITIPLIKKYGYISSSTAWENCIKSTKDLMVEAYNKEAEKGTSEEVEEIINWAKTLEATNDYLINASTAVKSEYCEFRDFALIGSFISSYYKHKSYLAAQAAREAANKAKAEASSYIGNIGDKITFTVKESRVLYSCGSYSYHGPETVAWEIIDTEGHVIIWKTASGCPQSGETWKGTVKGQKEYRGIPQTTITRGSRISARP